MRAPLAAFFDEALNNCFSSALEAILGHPARDEIYSILGRKGITKADVSSRFDDVVKVLTEAFGGCSRVIVHKVVMELYREYSQPVDFSYEDSLRDRLLFLKERVIGDHLFPRGGQGVVSFFDKDRRTEEEGPSTYPGGRTGWSGFYRLKRGVVENSNQEP